jgi:hypothetical protein
MSKLSKADEAAVAAGREYLAHWLREAHKHGGIVYDIPKVARSGMSRQIVLARVVPAKRGGDPRPAHIERLFPTLPESFYKTGEGGRSHGFALDAVAKDWGFSFKSRNFVIGGCGMNMVFALVDHLARIAGLESAEFEGHSFANACKKEEF